MDPVTTAILAALASGGGKVTEKLIVDAYNELKGLINRKLGNDNKVSHAIEALEAEPGFEPNKTALDGRVKQAEVNKDPEIQAAAQALLNQIKAQPDGEQHIQNAIGSYIAQADRGSTATVRVNQPEQQQ